MIAKELPQQPQQLGDIRSDPSRRVGNSKG